MVATAANGAKRPLRPSVQIISVTSLLEIDKKESEPKKKGHRKVKRGYHAGVDFPFYQIRRGRKIEKEERKTRRRRRRMGKRRRRRRGRSINGEAKVD